MKKQERVTGEEMKQECEEETESSMVVLTPKVTVLTGMPVGPPLSLPYVFLFLSNTQLSFLLPPASAAVQGPQTPVQRKHEHIHTQLSKHGGWRVWGGWGLRVQGPRGLSLEECCLYLKTHISHTAKK